MVVGTEKMANNHSRLHYVSLAFLNTDLDTDFTVPGAVSRGRVGLPLSPRKGEIFTVMQLQQASFLDTF